MTQRRRPPLRLPEAHLRQDRPDITPASARGRAFPIGDPARPRSDPEAIVAYLDVEASLRYRAAGGRTYCNVYACDYCGLAGVYLPRAWWTGDALGRITAGESVGVSYGKTVRELSANALYDWLENAWHPIRLVAGVGSRSLADSRERGTRRCDRRAAPQSPPLGAHRRCHSGAAGVAGPTPRWRASGLAAPGPGRPGQPRSLHGRLRLVERRSISGLRPLDEPAALASGGPLQPRYRSVPCGRVSPRRLSLNDCAILRRRSTTSGCFAA